MRNKFKKVRWSVYAAVCLSVSCSAHAGIMSDLSNLLSFLDPQQILQVGKALNTGQVQQITATEQLLNQKLQEQSLFKEELAGAEAKQNYLTQTDSISQLPGLCEQSQAAADLLQSSQSANVQGAMANAALGDEGDPGVLDEKSNLPTQQEKIQSLAALSGPGGTGPNQTDAHALFEGKDSGNALVVESTLLDPIPSQPITNAQSNTPAGIVWQSQHNAAEAGLSLAASSMGLVAGLHAISVPASAVSAVSAVVSAAPTNSAPTTSTPATSTSPTTSSQPAPSLAAVATRAPAQPPASTPGAGDWQKGLKLYVNQIAAAAQLANISPAIIAATIKHEDTSESLTAMPCSDPQSYPFGGTSSLKCIQQDSSAKSLGQMIDPTAISLGANYGLTNPMVVYGQHPNIELRAMATGLKRFLRQCNGNVACTFGAWYHGDVAPGMPNDVWPNAATAQYAAVSMGFYTGAKQVNVGSYQGGGTGGSGSGSNENPASTAGLLRLVSLGSYANPAFYNQLASTTPAGAWRTLVFLKAMSLRVSNQNRRLMERLSAIMATRVALSEQPNLHAENLRRGNAMAQSNGAMP